MILILDRGKLTYYEEIKDQLNDTNKDDISKAYDISVELMISRRPMKPLRIKSRFVLMTKLKPNLTSLKIRTRNHWRIKSRVKDIQHQMH